MFLSTCSATPAFAYDEVKCVKYMEGTQIQVDAMVKSDMLKVAKDEQTKKEIWALDTSVVNNVGYVLYCLKGQDINPLEEAGIDE